MFIKYLLLHLYNNNNKIYKIMKTIIEKRNKAEKARKLLKRVNSQLSDMQCIIHAGCVLDNKTFRMMLKNNPHIKKRFDDLHSRKFKLERIIWNNA